MDNNAGESSGAGTAAAGSGYVWLGGVSAGLAAGAVLWFMALGPLEPQVTEAVKEVAPLLAPDSPKTIAATAPAPSATTEPAAAPGAEAAAVPAPVDTTAVAGDAAVTSGDTGTSASATVAAPAAAPADQAAADQAAADQAKTALAPATDEPTFDTVRAEADGSVLVAGRAAPGAEVSVLADGAEVGRAAADATGQFAAFLTLGPSTAARVLTLSARTADGVVRSASANVILSPTPVPTASAKAEVAAVAPAAAPPTAPAAVPPSAPAAVASTAPASDAPAPETATAAPEVPAAAPATAVAETAAVQPEAPAATATATATAVTAEKPSAPDVLIADTKGVRKLAPGAAASIVIDTIAYSATGDVQLSGRAPSGGTARIYLDNLLVGEGPVDAQGLWAVTLQGIAAGRYTLRVDQVGADGKATSRFETPFQREAPDVVAKAAAKPPASAAATPATEPVLQPAPELAAAPPVNTATATTTDAAVPLAADAATPAALAADAAGLPPITAAAVVTVQPGFTLWRIARENYGDGMLYVKVFAANKDQIRDPDLIYPGQIFTVPQAN